VFYALEAQTGKKFLHGQAVCLGLILGSKMHQQRTEVLLEALVQLGLDIRPESMDLSWEEVNSTMMNLKEFVHRENLPYGISNDFHVTNSFLNRARQQIESAFE
ncbi:MAG: 3-dehydroquinate synthase, partial [bacterium]